MVKVFDAETKKSYIYNSIYTKKLNELNINLLIIVYEKITMIFYSSFFNVLEYNIDDYLLPKKKILPKIIYEMGTLINYRIFIKDLAYRYEIEYFI